MRNLWNKEKCEALPNRKSDWATCRSVMPCASLSLKYFNSTSHLIKEIKAIWKERMGLVRTRDSSHHFATQSSHLVDRAGWQAKMASIEFWRPWHNADKPPLFYKSNSGIGNGYLEGREGRHVPTVRSQKCWKTLNASWGLQVLRHSAATGVATGKIGSKQRQCPIQKHAGKSSIDRKTAPHLSERRNLLICDAHNCEELSKPFRPLYERIKSFEQRATFLPACFCMGRNLCLEPISPLPRVARFSDVITCKALLHVRETQVLACADERKCLRPQTGHLYYLFAPRCGSFNSVPGICPRSYFRA